MEEFSDPKVFFIAEQTGESEGRFKTAVAGLLRQMEEPITAYLCKVEYGYSRSRDRPFNVALCLLYKGVFRDDIINACSSVFYNMFGKNEHLDIIFITDEEESDLKLVCRSFITLA